MQALEKYRTDGSYPEVAVADNMIAAVFNNEDPEANVGIVVAKCHSGDKLREVETTYKNMLSIIEVLQEEFNVPDDHVLVQQLSGRV